MGIEHFLILALGLVIGAAVSTLFMHFRAGHGTLHVDHSDPKKDTYRFNLDRLDELDKKQIFIMRVKHDTNATQK